MKTYLYRASNLKSTITLSGLSCIAEVNFRRPPKAFVSCNKIIRECGSTLYVGLAHAVQPTTVADLGGGILGCHGTPLFVRMHKFSLG